MSSYSNFQVDRNKYKNQRNIFKKGRNQLKESTKSDKLMEGINIWTSYYRYRIDIFVKDYLGIQLKLFQIILIMAMQQNHYFMYLASRGQQGEV